MKILISFLYLFSAVVLADSNDVISRSMATSTEEINGLYRDLHQHPELGFQETRTAAILAAKMRALGLEVTEKVGKTGIVAVFKNGKGPTVMVRTELDALPLKEKTGLPFASDVTTELNGKKTSVAHSCGHDLHMAAWYGSAKVLVENKDKWNGTLVFIGQPSEENVQGAKAMLADGLYKRFTKPDYIFGAHVSNEEIGTLSVTSGNITLAIDDYSIKFLGLGGHGSSPNETIDPIIIGADFVNSIQSIISREKDPSQFGVITVGSFQSGYASNIIPDKAELKLTLRSVSPEVRKLLNQRVNDKARIIAASHLAKAPEITYLGGAGAIYNDKGLVSLVTQAIRENTHYRIENSPITKGSEDFSEYIIDGVKGTYFSFGGYSKQQRQQYKNANKPIPYNHSPEFAPDYQQAIPVSIQIIVNAVLAVSHK